MRKKIIAAALTLTLALSLAGCASSAGNPGPSSDGIQVNKPFSVTLNEMVSKLTTPEIEKIEKPADAIDSIFYKLEENVLYIRPTEAEGYTEKFVTEHAGLTDIVLEKDLIHKVVIEKPMALKNCTGMFYDFKNMTEIENLQNLDTSHCTSFASMFRGCESLTSLDISHFATSRANSMAYMFKGCYNLTDLNLGDFDMRSAEDLSNMFAYCSNLKELDVSEWNVRSVRTTDHMFNNCDSLTYLDMSSWETPNLTYMYNMFYDCDKLQSVNIGSFNMARVQSVAKMADGCENLNEVTIPSDNSNDLENGNNMIFGTDANVAYELSAPGRSVVLH